MKWLGAASSLIIFFVITPSAFAAWADSENAGSAAGNMVLDAWGTKDKIGSSVSEPVTSDTQMKTFDGSTLFDVNISCPSSNAFLTIVFGLGAGGDISGLTLGQDTDFDGTQETAYGPLSMDVSGVCSNGAISCDSGTWNNCNYYKWTADATGVVSLSAGSVYDLSGCYCVNDSCGSSLVWSNMSIILDDLGGGAVDAIQSVKSTLSIAQSDKQDFTVSYYGQSPDNCGAYLTGDTSSYSDYYSGGDSALTDATSSASGTDSNYTLLSTSLAAAGSTGDMITCSVEQVYSATTQDYTLSGSGSGNTCVENDMQIRINTVVADTTYDLQVMAQGYSAGCSGAGAWTTVATVNIGGPLSTTAADTLFSVTATDGTCTLSANTSLVGVDTAVGAGSCGSVSARNMTYSFNYSLAYQADVISDYMDDQCSSVSAGCELKDETIDGVITYQSYQPSGLSATQSCQDFTTSLATYTECKSWWLTERTYFCDTGTSYDFSDFQTRSACIQENVVDNGTSFTYSDCTKDSAGTWTSTSNTSALPDRQSLAECELWCKTKIPSTNTLVNATGGNNSQSLTDTSTYEYVYKACDTSGACPIDSSVGEVIDTDCGCLNESSFTEAAAYMESLDSAGSDMICSSGTKL